jgi:hypothetical protein
MFLDHKSCPLIFILITAISSKLILVKLTEDVVNPPILLECCVEVSYSSSALKKISSFSK